MTRTASSVDGDAVPALFGVSVVLLGLRLYAATHVGFGDSEALYAAWAAHPQPAYLDHPGLVGVVARAVGEGAVPTPLRAHLFTSVIATLVPWSVVAVARAAGAARRHATIAGIVVALVPEIAVGLFALTPDLVLAPLWLGATGLAIVGLKDSAGRNDARTGADGEGVPSSASAAALVGAGLLAGIAAAAKVSSLLLAGSLAVVYVLAARGRYGARASRGARTLWPWAGLGAGGVVLVPFFIYEAKLGFPMLRHRFVETQHGAGLALKNVAALVGGQLAYLSPVLAILAAFVAVDLVRRRNDDAAASVLFHAFALPLLPLFVLCVWSPVAEPHWLAPPLLALPIHAARRATDIPRLRRRFVVVGAAVAGLMTLAAHVYVLVPASARLLPRGADPKLDIASELYGWPQAIAAVREHMLLAATPVDPEGREVFVIGPHWTICAQLDAALAGVRVGCATPTPDDFDGWEPRARWRSADTVLFVTDARYPGDGAEQLPALARISQSRVRVLRGGVTTRVFDLYLYSRRSNASLEPTGGPSVSPR